MKKKLPAPSLDSSTAAKVLQADLGNLLKRVQAGTPLTHRQRSLIEASAAPAAPAQPDDDPGEDRSKPPRSAAELGRRLGVSRQRICSWMQRKDSPPIADVRGWRHFLGSFARVPLKPDDSTPKAPTDPENRNPYPRLFYCDGIYSALSRFGETLPGRLAALAAPAGLAPRPEQLDALALGLFLEHVASMNAVLRSWSFEPFEPADYPEAITASIERLA